MRCEVIVHYLQGKDVLTQRGSLVPVVGPFSDCIVIEVDDTHVVFIPSKIIKIVVKEMPDFFMIEEEHLHMMKERMQTHFKNAHTQVEENVDNDGVYFA